MGWGDIKNASLVVVVHGSAGSLETHTKTVSFCFIVSDSLLFYISAVNDSSSAPLYKDIKPD